jgi:hypothetical protein
MEDQLGKKKQDVQEEGNWRKVCTVIFKYERMFLIAR